MTRIFNPQFAEPVLVSDTDTLLQIQALRRHAWSANGEVPTFIAQQNILRDEHDLHGMHWAILHAGRPVAAARMCIHETISCTPDPEALEGYEHFIEAPIASFTRLVIDPDFRRLGLPKPLREVRLRVAAERGCRSIVAVAEEESVMIALEARGFIRLGPTRIRYLSYAPSIVLLKRLDGTRVVEDFTSLQMR